MVVATFTACSSHDAAELPVIDDVPPRADSGDSPPPLAVTVAVEGRSAHDILELSDAAMRQQPAVTVTIEEFAEKTSTNTTSFDVLPEQFATRPDLDSGNIDILRQLVDRVAGGFRRISPIETTNLGVTPARDARIIGAGQVDGRDAWVIWYRYTAPSIESPYDVWRFEWIAQDDFTLLRQVSDWFDPWGPAGWRLDLSVSPSS